MSELRPYKVLFLCTSNSARSIMAEAILRKKGTPNFLAFSAGSHPLGTVRPEAISQIEAAKFSLDGLRSKSWAEFTGPEAPQLDFVLTVCDNAAKEECPLWPGQPMTAHWSVSDPAAVNGTEQEKAEAYARTFATLESRINYFLCFPSQTRDRFALQRHLEEAGRL